MPDQKSPICDTNDEARRLARSILQTANTAALGVQDPDTGGPMVTRIACVCVPNHPPLTLISDLSAHTKALRASSICSLLLSPPLLRGDPLNQPRITLQSRAVFVDRKGTGFAALREHYLQHYPKAKLYVDFTDFNLVQFEVTDAFLNGGFGKAYRLRAQDLGL